MSKKHRWKRGPMSDAHKAKIAAAKRATPAVIWSKVEKKGADECWPWKGFRNEQGYGRTWIDGRAYYAHRVIFNLANPGIIELPAPKSRYENGFLRHSCDNPPCCNPAHLLVGTHLENMQDKVKRGRAKWFSGSIDSPRAKLREQDVRDIRRMKKEGATLKALSLLYEVSRATICGVLYGRHYQDVA